MTKTITAAEILAMFKAGNTDFNHLGVCEVVGELSLGRIIVDSEVKLGSLIFQDEVKLDGSGFSENFDCDNARFLGGIDCGSAEFEFDTYFHCNNAIFRNFDCKKAHFCILFTGDVTYTQKFKCGEATIFGLYCGKSKFQNGFGCGSAKIRYLDFDNADFCDELSLDGATVDQIGFDECTFEKVSVHNDRYSGEGNPAAIAWVIQQYIQSKVVYAIEHAPPWLQRPKTEEALQK